MDELLVKFSVDFLALMLKLRFFFYTRVVENADNLINNKFLAAYFQSDNNKREI